MFDPPLDMGRNQVNEITPVYFMNAVPSTFRITMSKKDLKSAARFEKAHIFPANHQ